MTDEDSALRQRGSPGKSSIYNDDDIEEIDGLSGKITDTSRRSNNVYPDPIADQLLSIYKSLNLVENEMIKYAFIAVPIGFILFFYIFISQSTSSLICFISWNFSILFVFISIGILCEIINKDVGPKAM